MSTSSSQSLGPNLLSWRILKKIKGGKITEFRKLISFGNYLEFNNQTTTIENDLFFSIISWCSLHHHAYLSYFLVFLLGPIASTYISYHIIRSSSFHILGTSWTGDGYYSFKSIYCWCFFTIKIPQITTSIRTIW